MVAILIETQDTVNSVAKNILKTSIPPRNGYAHWEEGQDSKKQIAQ